MHIYNYFCENRLKFGEVVKPSPASILSLQSELLQEIFSHLSLRELLKCKTVCRQFRSEILKVNSHEKNLKLIVEGKRTNLERHNSKLYHFDNLRIACSLIAAFLVPTIALPFTTNIPFNDHTALQLIWGVAIITEIIALDIFIVNSCCKHTTEAVEERQLRDTALLLENDIARTMQRELSKNCQSYTRPGQGRAEYSSFAK